MSGSSASRPASSRFHDPVAGREVARYLGLSLHEVGDPEPGHARVEGTVALGAHLRGPDGSVSAGALLALADSVGGLCCGIASLPRWIVSANLSLHVCGPVTTDRLVLRAESWRAGRHAVVTGITVHDGDGGGALVADSTITSSVLVPDGGPPFSERPVTIDTAHPEDLPPLEEFVALRTAGPNAVAIDIAERLRNPWGILHGGITAALVDLAARHTTGGSVTTDAVVHFLAPGRVGPVVVSTRVLGERADGTVVRVGVADRGADDRVMAIGVITVR